MVNLWNSVFFWFLFSFFYSSCTCNSLPKKVNMAIIYYRNSQGQDLLNPGTSGYYGQNGFVINWTNPDKTIGSKIVYPYQIQFKPSTPYLNSGYCISIDPELYGGITTVKYLQLTKSDTDTLAFHFSGFTLNQFFYNSTLISPPNNLYSYPQFFPVNVVK